MGRIVTRDLLMGGFKYRYNDGVVEHFMPYLLGDGFKGDFGSRIEPAFFGGYVAKRYDGHHERVSFK